MLATFNYHTKGGVEALEFILDDDASKNTMSYRNIDIDIVYSGEVQIDEDIVFVLTSYENNRNLVKKLTDKYSNRLISGLIF